MEAALVSELDGLPPAVVLTKRMLTRLVELADWCGSFGAVLGLADDPAIGPLVGADVPSIEVVDGVPNLGPLAAMAAARGMEPDRLRAGVIEACVIANALPPQAIDIVGR